MPETNPDPTKSTEPASMKRNGAFQISSEPVVADVEEVKAYKFDIGSTADEGSGERGRRLMRIWETCRRAILKTRFSSWRATRAGCSAIGISIGAGTRRPPCFAAGPSSST